MGALRLDEKPPAVPCSLSCYDAVIALNGFVILVGLGRPDSVAWAVLAGVIIVTIDARCWRLASVAAIVVDSILLFEPVSPA